MASVTLYPNSISGHTNDTIPYRKLLNPNNIKTSSTSSANCSQWGANKTDVHNGCNPSNTLRNYCQGIAGKNGSRKRPATIKVTDYRANLPANANVSNVKVEYYYYKGSYSSETSHAEFSAPKITMIGVSGLSKTGTAPVKESGDTSSRLRSVNFPVNLKGADVSKTGFGVEFNLPANTNTNPCYIRIAFIRIILTYTAESYTPKITITPTSGQYGNKFLATLTVTDVNKVKSSGTLQCSVTIPSGLTTPVVKSVQGSYSGGVWNAQLNNYSAQLVLELTSSGPTQTGNRTVTLKELFGNNSVSASIRLDPVTYTPSCNLTNNTLEVSKTDDTENISHLNIKVKTSSPANTTITLNIIIPEGLIIVGDVLRQKIVNGVYTINPNPPGNNSINPWDANREHYISIPIRGVIPNDEETPYKVKVSSPNFTNSYSFDIFVTRPESTGGLYYTSFRLTNFSYDNMKDGKKYVFYCLGKYEGTQIDKSAKNLRAVVINGEAPIWSEQINLKNGEWVALICEFTYNNTYPVEIQLYGDYIDWEYEGDPYFANFCLVDADKWYGYEYPVFHLDPIYNLLNNSNEWASCIFTPEKPRKTTKHYLNTFDYKNLLEAEKIIIHGISVEFDTEFDEQTGLQLGIGRRGSNVNDFAYESTSVSPDTTHVIFGGKYENWGIPYAEIQKFLPDLEITLELDNDCDKKEIDYEVKVNNVMVTVYFSDDVGNECGFSIDDVHCKYLNINWKNGKIPEGSNFTLNNLVIEGGDGEEVTRANIRNKNISLDIGFEDESFSETQILKDYVVKYLTPRRDRLDRPIPKKISFDYQPDRYYSYVIDKAYDFEPDGNGYKGPVNLIIPDGVGTSKTIVTNQEKGTIKGNGKVKPLILIRKTYENNLPDEDRVIVVKDSVSGQQVILRGSGLDKLGSDALLLIDCENLLVHYKNKYIEINAETGEEKEIEKWELLDLECVDVLSQFFILQERFNFEQIKEQGVEEGTRGCNIENITYYNKY